MPEYKSPQNEPGMERRFLLVFLLMAVVIFASQLLMKKYMPQQPPSNAKPAQQPIQAPPAQSQGQTQATNPIAQASRSAARTVKSAPPVSTRQAQTETETTIENDLYRI